MEKEERAFVALGGKRRTRCPVCEIEGHRKDGNLQVEIREDSGGKWLSLKCWRDGEHTPAEILEVVDFGGERIRTRGAYGSDVKDSLENSPNALCPLNLLSNASSNSKAVLCCRRLTPSGFFLPGLLLSGAFKVNAVLTTFFASSSDSLIQQSPLSLIHI